MTSNPELNQKIEQWKANLIDLSKRNRLLNFRETKTGSVNILYPQPEDAFDTLVKKGREMIFKWQGRIFNDIQEMSLSEISFGNYKLNQKDLITAKNEGDQNRILNTIRLRSNTAFLEQGVNILYVAFGMLNWTEADASDKIIRSPLFLAPVKIKRESITEPFKIKLLEEEIIFNPTLLQKLLNDFNLTFQELPDLDDFDLSTEYRKIETKINKLPGWNITNEVHLGLFSFKKFIMFKDLETYSKVLGDHPIVCALAGDSSKLPKVPRDLPTAEKLDYEIKPEETFQILDADSSQQEAIIAAKRGVSFIIQGPPGTGKSQTIANIIAECLEADKTVLFVSEKMAALEVVKKRLDQHSLGEFCLELHSHKANKKQVITELGNTLDAENNRPKVNSKQLQKLNELQKLRGRLNSYVMALHKKRTKLNLSAYQVHGELAALDDAPDLRFKVPNISDVNDQSFEEYDTLLDRLTSMGHIYDNHLSHPWKGCNIGQYSFEVQNTVQEDFESYKNTITNVQQRGNNLASILSYSPPKNVGVAEWLCKCAEHLTVSPSPPEAWINDSDLTEIGDLALEGESITSKYLTEINAISNRYDKEIFSLDIQSLYSRFLNDYTSFFRIFKGSYKQDMNKLSQYSKNSKLKYNDALKDLKKMIDVTKLKRQLEGHEINFKKTFRHYYIGEKTDWSQISNALEWTSKLQNIFSNNTVPDKVVKIASNDIETRSKLSGMKPDKIREYINKGLAQRHDKIMSYFDEEPDLFSEVPFNKCEYLKLYQWIEQKIENIQQLKDWISYYGIIKKFKIHKLQDFIDNSFEKELDSKSLKSAFYKGFYRHWIDYVYSEDEVLINFSSKQHEAYIERFVKLDTELINISEKRLVLKLANKKPHNQWVDAPSSEQSIIKREANKKRRHKPIRVLFSEISNLLLTIKPCILMSPLSVSQFIDPDIYKFDVVVFDEASQICPEDAIGAIMRGREVIVVGDNKQLPPTKFFVSSGVDDFDDESYEEMDEFESILDECDSIGLPSKLLMWHYRSKHENLIAFSNFNFYMNRLNTFPSITAKDDYAGVEHVYVEGGVYDRGKSRRNVDEARKVADLVFEHFRTHPDKTLGVVAFSEAQMLAINDELERKRREDTSLEPFFNEDLEENFFVRNLENVQGDEREVMFFSVGYGKDALGRMSMSFGPLNQKGGERRLNVAITRARSHVKLVSSILPYDMDVSKTQSRGVKLLKNYMEYAQDGPSAMFAHSAEEIESDFDSPFEEEVWNALVAEGFKVQKQVGCSGYKIDLAIVDSDKPGLYLLGIECDGASYHSGKTARDRDRLRQQVLENLGWRIHRIWSRDWIDNPKGEIEKIKKALTTPVKKKQPLKIEPEIEEERDESFEESEEVDEENDNFKLPSNVKYYSKTNVQIFGEPKEFYGSYQVGNILYRVVQVEGPIHIREASRRVAQFWCMNKAGSKIINNIIYRINCSDNLSLKDEFVWKTSMTTPKVRIPAPGHKPRTINLIAKEEIGEAACLVVENAFSLTREDIIAQTARLFGFNRTGEMVRKRVGSVVTTLQQKNRLEKLPNGQLQIPKINHCKLCGHMYEIFNGMYRCPECDTYCEDCGNFVAADAEECSHCGTSFLED